MRVLSVIWQGGLGTPGQRFVHEVHHVVPITLLFHRIVLTHDKTAFSPYLIPMQLFLARLAFHPQNLLITLLI